MNREPKHTPGPWEAGFGRIVGIPEDTFGVYIYTPGQKGRNGNPRVVAVTGRVSDAEYRDESISDAFLIAAAPEMYEALRELAASFDHPAYDDPRDTTIEIQASREAIADARRALAKARGEDVEAA